MKALLKIVEPLPFVFSLCCSQDLNEMKLTAAYYNQMRPSIEDHMRKAGVHLARILEAVFGNQIIGIEA